MRGARLNELTLGLQEHALLNTALQGTVEEGVKHGVGGVDLVVGLDILLQALAAFGNVMSANVFCSDVVCLTPSPSHDGFMHLVRGHETRGAGWEGGGSLPRTIAILELERRMTRQYH